MRLHHWLGKAVVVGLLLAAAGCGKDSDADDGAAYSPGADGPPHMATLPPADATGGTYDQEDSGGAPPGAPPAASGPGGDATPAPPPGAGDAAPAPPADEDDGNAAAPSPAGPDSAPVPPPAN